MFLYHITYIYILVDNVFKSLYLSNILPRPRLDLYRKHLFYTNPVVKSTTNPHRPCNLISKPWTGSNNKNTGAAEYFGRVDDSKGKEP